MNAYWQTLVADTYGRRAQQHRPQSRDEMRAAVHELAAGGMTDYGIAHATGLAVEQVRRLLGEFA